MAFIKRSKVEIAGIIDDLNHELNDEDTRKQMKQAAIKLIEKTIGDDKDDTLEN